MRLVTRSSKTAVDCSTLLLRDGKKSTADASTV